MNYEETLKNIEKFIEKRPDASAYQDYFDIVRSLYGEDRFRNWKTEFRFLNFSK